MKPTSRGLAPSLNTGHSTFTGARQRLAVALIAIVMAFAGAQTARAQTGTVPIKFDISDHGTVVFGGAPVENGETIYRDNMYDYTMILMPDDGYVVWSVSYYGGNANVILSKYDDFNWNIYIPEFIGSNPWITMTIVFAKALAGGADEASAVTLTSDDDLSRLTGGWYKVESDLTFGHTVNFRDDTHITIATGATFTVNTSESYGISGSSLNVSGEGTLAVTASGRAINVYNYSQTGSAVTLSGIDGLYAKNDVNISGGSLTTSGSLFGIHAEQGSITISGGNVSSSGSNLGLIAYSAVSITGGQVTASGGGIKVALGDITLGWTSPTDYITASGYNVHSTKQVKIAGGQAFWTDDATPVQVSGTVSDVGLISGKKLTPTGFTTNADGSYTIKSAAGWGVFCDLLDDNAKGYFTGKTVYLDKDISVTRMAGGQYHDFTGTFNGGGHTITVSYGSAESPLTEIYAAPFRYIENAEIHSLVVEGDIYTREKCAGGIVSLQCGSVTIRNCRSSVSIHSSVSGDGTHGGLVAVNNGTGSNLTIEGCVFDGKLLTTNSTDECGGFIGYRSGAAEIRNSLFDPAEVTVSTEGSATFARNNVDTYNCYYTYLLCDGTNYVPQYVEATETTPAKWYNGKAACPAAAAPVGTATHDLYTVSGITPYANGITRTVGDATTFYYGGGDIVSVSYVDENGSNASHDATALDETMNTLAAGWYYLGKDINYTQGVSLTSDATIILTDGMTMTTSGNSYGIDGSSDGSLTIYGQALGTGTLNATGTTIGIYTDGDVTINGGTVNANGTNDVGIRSVDGVTINRGTVTTTGIMADGDITINGGKFTATDDPGISSNDGTVTLGWTSTDDRIRADSYQGTVKIASGKGLYNGSEVLSGIITDMTKLEEETLTPAVVLVDNDDNDDNTTAIATAATACTGDKTLAVQLAGRTLYKDGAWNTLCLPFNVTIADSPLAGATVKELLTTSNLDNGTLTLNFSDNLSAIEAGKPYIVKWAKADGYDEAAPETRDVKNPVFPGVTVANTTPTAVEFSIANSSDKCQFVGQYSPFDITAGNINSIIMLGAKNTLGYSKNPRTLRSFRAHFEVPTHTDAPAMNSFVLDFGDESTGISLTPDPSPRGEGSEYYTLDGRKLDGKPTKKGMYIVNGRKVVIK